MADCCCSPAQEVSIRQPERLDFGWIDYLKALRSWIKAFSVTSIVEPGLYYIGERYDVTAPLLVTGNYHLTVFTLWRELRTRRVRILVIDTGGINVWCSSGKGNFSAEAILAQIGRYNRSVFGGPAPITLILPKLSLSGVSLAALKKCGIRPLIGPIYASRLPAYLDELPLKNRNDDRYLFSIRDRLFTLVPSLVQTIRYSLWITVVLYLWHYVFPTGIFWQILPITIGIVTLYVLLFPFLPTRQFAVKGLALFAASAALYGFDFAGTGYIIPDLATLLFYVFFTSGACLFFALSYTGNSGVSNYSLVKREIVRYLPVTAALFLGAIITIIIKGVRG